MKSAIALFLCLTVMSLPGFAAEGKASYGIVYDGGSLSQIKSGADLKLFVNPTTISLNKGATEIATIPAASITEISYGQDVHRRIGSAIALGMLSFGVGALMMFSKSKKHFIGVTWADGANKGGFAMQCNKKQYRGILAALEGVSGKKAVDSTTMGVKN